MKSSPERPDPPSADGRPHIVIVVPRGEAVRNFLYSSTLETLAEQARVTLLTVVDDPESLSRFEPYLERSLRLEAYPPHSLVSWIRAAAESRPRPLAVGHHHSKRLDGP